MKNLNEMKLDALKEVGNIGAGNAATSLAEMTSMTIDITVPDVLVEVADAIPGQLGGNENIAISINMGIEGDFTGSLMVLLPFDGALKVIDLMMFMPPGTTQTVDEMGQSALMELGNILASSYLNALSGLTGTYLLPSPPIFSMDKAEIIINNVLGGLNIDVNRTIFVQTEFTSATTNIGGGIVFLLTHDSMDKLFNILGLN